MRIYTKYLIFDNGGNVRVTATTRRLAYNEVAYKLTVNVPNTWGTLQGEVNFDLPEVTAGVSKPEQVEQEVTEE